MLTIFGQRESVSYSQWQWLVSELPWCLHGWSAAEEDMTLDYISHAVAAAVYRGGWDMAIRTIISGNTY